LPSLQEEFDASSSSLQWMVDAYMLVFAGLLLTMGTLGDRFGRKLALQTGLVLFGGASLAVLLVDTTGQLIAVRCVMGLGGALIMPATLSVISNVFPREERAKAIGVWSAMAAMGVGLGPLFGGLLLEWFDWTSVFLLNVPVAALTLVLGIRLVPESRDPRPGAFDVPGAVLSTAGLVALVYAIIEAPDEGWTSPLVLGLFAAALALGAAFVRHELRTANPMLNLSFFRDPRFSVASMSLGLASFAMFGAVFASTQFLQDANGYSALEAGAAMAPTALGLLVGSVSSVKLGPRFGTSTVLTAGLVGLAGVLATSTLWEPGMAYWPLGLWFFGLSLTMGWIMGPATSSVMSTVPEEKSGVASAMNDVTRQVGGALGTAVIGSLITSLYASRLGTRPTGSPTERAPRARTRSARPRRSPRPCPPPRGRGWPTRRASLSPTRSGSASPSRGRSPCWPRSPFGATCETAAIAPRPRGCPPCRVSRRSAASLSPVPLLREHQLLGQGGARRRRGIGEHRHRLGHRPGDRAGAAVGRLDDDLLGRGRGHRALHPRLDPGLLQVVQKVLRLVLEAQDRHARAGLHVGQRHALDARAGDDRMPVGARLGVADRGQHARLEHRRHRVLQALGLFVDLVPRDPEDVGQEALDQPVAADDALGVLLPGGREGDRLVVAARDVAVAFEPADHLVHRGRGQLHRAGDVGPRHAQPRLVQPEEGLEVLLLGDGGVRGRHTDIVPAPRGRSGAWRAAPRWPLGEGLGQRAESRLGEPDELARGR
jgi:EmrB/QacA subfamily drug resistance transporter